MILSIHHHPSIYLPFFLYSILLSFFLAINFFLSIFLSISLSTVIYLSIISVYHMIQSNLCLGYILKFGNPTSLPWTTGFEYTPEI